MSLNPISTHALSHQALISNTNNQAQSLTNREKPAQSKSPQAADRLDFHTQNQIFAGGVGIMATALSFGAAQKFSELGASVGGVKGALAGAIIGGLGTAALVGAGTATVSDPIFNSPEGLVAGASLAGAAFGLYKGGVKGAVIGAAIGAGVGLVAKASAQ